MSDQNSIWLDNVRFVAHEMKAPVSAITGFIDLAENTGPLNESQQEFLDRAKFAAERLLRLADVLVEAARIDSGKPLALAEADMRAVIQHEVQQLEPLARQMQVSLHVEVAPDLGLSLFDQERISHAVSNLISNAIKYNRPQGCVTIGTRHAGQHPTIEVSDTGRGLTQDQLAHLFEPFNRLGAESDVVEGSGIGLVIVKTFVERMGGKVAVDSEPGRGTRFRVTLPGAKWAGLGGQPARLPAEAGLQAADAGTHAARGRLLYIEDNAVNVLLVRELVTRRPGIEMLSAADGSQGVALALAQRPELVLIDMQLPDFDGFEVLHRLRAAPDGASLRCIALSANALPQDIERALAAGFADYWTKPIDFARFLAGIDAAFGVAPRAG